MSHNGCVLNIVLPKGSLERATLDLFSAADLTVHRSSDVDYRATIDDPRIDEVRILRPQEIPVYVAEGRFDLGITGRDWIEERGATVESIGELGYSKATSNPIRVVLAVAGTSPYESIDDLISHAGTLRVSTEYPELTSRALAERGISAEVSLSYGATEAKVPDIADCVVEITETGRALRAAGLKVIHTLLISRTEADHDPAGGDARSAREGARQAQRLDRAALPRARRAALAALPDGLGTVGWGRLCRRDGGREAGDQHPDPSTEGQRRHGHHRAGAVKDRALR